MIAAPTGRIADALPAVAGSGRAALPRHRVAVLDTLGDLQTVRALWVASPRHALADFDFFVTIANVRRDSSRPLVLVLYRGDVPVALLAGRIDDERRALRFGYATLATVRLRQVRFIAGGFLGETSLQNLVRLIDATERVLRERGLGLAVFEQVEPGGALAGLLARRVGGFGRWRQTRLQAASTHWRLQLPPTWPDFLRQRSAKHRYWINRLPRVLENDFPGRWRIETCTGPHEADAFLKAAEHVAATAYHRALGVGFRCDTEYIERVKLDARSGRLRGYVLRLDGVPAAFWYGVAYRGTLHLIATAYVPSLQRHELGTVLLMRVFRDHCGSGTTEVDFGLGDAAYKQRFGSESRLEGPVHCFASTPRGFSLRIVMGALAGVDRLLRRLVAALSLTRWLKTFWRRHLGASTAAIPVSASVDRGPAP